MSQSQVLKIVEREKIITISKMIEISKLNLRTVLKALQKLVQNNELGRIHRKGWITVYCSNQIMEELNGN